MQNSKEHQLMFGGPIPNADPHFSRIWLKALLHRHEGLPNFRFAAGVFREGTLHPEYDAAALASAASLLTEWMISKPAELELINQRLEQALIALQQGMHILPLEGLAQRSNEELWAYYQRHETLHGVCAALAWVTILPEQGGSHVSKWLDRRIGGEGASAALAFAEYTSDECQQRDLLSLASEIQSQPELAREFLELVRRREYQQLLNRLSAKWLHRLEDHHRRYCFTSWLEAGPHALDVYLNAVADVLGQGIDAAKQLMEQDKQKEMMLAKRESLLSRLELTESEKAFVDAYRKSLSLKPLRRYVQQYALYRIDAVLEEIGRRLKLDASAVRWMLPSEVESALLSGSPVHEAVHTRRLACRYVATAGGESFEAAECVPATPVQDTMLARELRGITASRGYGRGTVFSLADTHKMKDVPDGAVLLIDQARPEYTQIFKKAVAVICEQGGVTSHTALIAREMGVPCIVAAKRASHLLKTGMEVEVDANRGLIRVL